MDINEIRIIVIFPPFKTGLPQVEDQTVPQLKTGRFRNLVYE